MEHHLGRSRLGFWTWGGCGCDIYIVGGTDSFGAGWYDAFLVRYGFPPVGGVVLSTSFVENLFYVAIAISIVAFLAVVKMRQKILSPFSFF